jgi:hypothetical protein
MNPNNYASLEAAQRLVDAGIMLEKTDCVWIYARHIPLKGAGRTWQLFDRRSLMAVEVTEQRPDCMIPAVQFAEVWRELPEEYCLNAPDPVRYKMLTTSCAGYHSGGKDAGVWIPYSTNVVDALIDLYIWTVKQKGEEG